MKIGFLGMGKLGLPVALAIESKGHEVIGYDIDPKIKRYLKNKKIPYMEENVDEHLQNTKIKMVPLKTLVKESDLIFVAVQTPHDPMYEGITRLPKERKDFDYIYLVKAIRDLDIEANEQKTEKIVVVISTVLPGTLDSQILSYISNRLKICYNPFFIAMGTTINDFLFPEFILLGVVDKETEFIVTSFYKTITEASVFNCSLKTAEAIKVLYNTYISGKICFANAAMELCHKTGAKVDDVTNALTWATKRIISPMYMSGGMGDGGGCHPRDNIALSGMAKKFNISYDWWENLMICREKQTEWLANFIIRQHNTIAVTNNVSLPVLILGKSFKPETNITTGSPSILLYNILLEICPPGMRIDIYDPIIDDRVKDDSIYISENSIAIFNYEKSIFFIGTKHEIFKDTLFPTGSVVIDPWRYIPNQDGVRVIRIGE